MMFKVHGYLDKVMVINHRMQHLPRLGEIVRLHPDKFAKVTEIVWCMDEPSEEGQRVNIGLKSD